jgi:hypothetical protein
LMGSASSAWPAVRSRQLVTVNSGNPVTCWRNQVTRRVTFARSLWEAHSTAVMGRWWVVGRSGVPETYPLLFTCRAGPRFCPQRKDRGVPKGKEVQMAAQLRHTGAQKKAPGVVGVALQAAT